MILWRRIMFVLVVLGAQGVMGVVLPVFVSPPDLFLLTALALTSRLTPLWTLAVGYGLGLAQDILGAGALGFHALLVKWLVFIALGYWTRLDAMNLETLLYRFVPEIITTLLLGPLFFAFFNWAFGKSRSNEDRLF